MRDHTITLYKFDELPTDAAKEKARDWMRTAQASDNFAEQATDELTDLLNALGFRPSTARRGAVGYQVFWNTNPIEAAFDGTWSAQRLNAEACKAMLKDRPAMWTDNNGARHVSKSNAETTRIIKAFVQIAAAWPDSTGSANSGSRGNNQTADFDYSDEMVDPNALDGTSDVFEQLVQDIANAFATAVNDEYEYRMSDEAIEEDIRANDYEFTANGDAT